MHEDCATTEDGQDLPEAFMVNRKGLPEKLFTLRQTLYLKAKREPTFRFYTLYGLIRRRDVLEAAAWDSVARNEGAPGVDGVTIEEIEAAPRGREELLAELEQEIQAKTYERRASSEPARLPTTGRYDLLLGLRTTPRRATG
jgi:RNA-directed DNA polymerase